MIRLSPDLGAEPTMAQRRVLLAVLAAGGVAMTACGHDGRQAELARPGANVGLFYNDQGRSASLAYGVANSDDVALMLECVKGSGQVKVSDVVRKTPAKTLVLASAGARTELAARIEAGESEAPRILAAAAPADAAALKGFRKSGRIEVAFGDVRYGVRATAEEQTGVERFFSACERA